MSLSSCGFNFSSSLGSSDLKLEGGGGVSSHFKTFAILAIDIPFHFVSSKEQALPSQFLFCRLDNSNICSLTKGSSPPTTFESRIIERQLETKWLIERAEVGIIIVGAEECFTLAAFTFHRALFPVPPPPPPFFATANASSIDPCQLLLTWYPIDCPKRA